MSRDLDQLLHDTAVGPTDLPDPSELVARGRRRRLRRHAAGTVAGAATAVLVGIVVLQAVPTESGPEILDQPEELEGDGIRPNGWVVLRAGDLEVSVPPDWQVHTVEPAPDPGAQAGPCASDLYGGIANSTQELTAPLAVVYPMETTGMCRAIGLPDRPPEQPSLVLHAAVASDGAEVVAPHEGSEERIGSVNMLRLESEPHGHIAEFQRRDGQGGLLVSHLDDPIVQQVLETLRTIDAADEGTAAAMPPTVTGSPVLTASGGVPFAWTVTVSPGEGGQLCGDAVFGMNAVDRTGQPCAVVVGPDAAGNELFGSGGSSTNPEGQKLVWGRVDPDVTEVVVELADGSTSVATVAVGGDRGDPDERLAVWAFATEGEITARIARAENGTEERLES